MNPLRESIRSPMLLAPNRVWRMYQGGCLIERLKGVVEPKDSSFPEEWVGSTVQAANPGAHYREGEGLALVSTGFAEGVTLKSVMERFPEEMLGPAHVKTFGTNAALLTKLLDTANRLVIHAHPTKAFAKQHLGNCFGKTEAWFVVGTRDEAEDPYVMVAFKDNVSRERYRTMLDRQDIPSMLSVMHRLSVRTGDVVYVKAGLPHAIGEGVLIVELQEPTDYSIMLERNTAEYNFSIEESFLGLDPSLTLSVIDHRVYSSDEVRRELVIRPRVLRREGESMEAELLGYDTTECFTGRRLEVKGRLGDDSNGRYALLIVLAGEGTLVHAGGELPLHPGLEVFIPAAVGIHEFLSAKGLTVFKCLPAQA